MSRTLRFALTGGLAVAMGVGGIWNSFAWQNEPNPAPVPHFPLPSDKVPLISVPYPTEADPNTGEIVPNTEVVDGQTGRTGLNFLTFRIGGHTDRLDTPVSACAYYTAIGAVQGCDADGTLKEPITFDQWKHDVGIDQYAQPGTSTDVAQFINQVDLNLTRDHHMISYASDKLAAYVCNHEGPPPTEPDPTGFFPPQKEIDSLIKNIKLKQKLIACVAMEYSTHGHLKPDFPAPFTKFFIFGPEGALLSTVDLDGEGPKGVPHVCTACHGGPFHSETSVSIGSVQTQQFNGSPDLGAHFLPFDKDNFAFSSKLSEAQQDEAIFQLNLDVYTTEFSLIKHNPDTTITDATLASASIADLISDWYHDKLTRDNPAPGFDPNNTVTPQWDFLLNSDPTIYLNSYAHSCRTCHVAMDNRPLQRTPGQIQSLGPGPVCNQHTMPNAKVTFNRFWLSNPDWTFPPVPVPGQPPLDPQHNQPDLLNNLTKCSSFNNP